MKRLECTAENAPRFREWIEHRGGIAVWQSVDLGRPGQTVSTPADRADKPYWWVDSKPHRVVTDPRDIDVVTEREVRRFHVAVRVGSQGLRVKCTDGSTRKIRKAVERAGEGARYAFDYESQEAVILVPDQIVPLDRWIAQQDCNHVLDGSTARPEATP